MIWTLLPEGPPTGSVAVAPAPESLAQKGLCEQQDGWRMESLSAASLGGPTPLTSCRSAAVRSGTRLYTWLLSTMGGSASSNRPRGNSRTSSATAARTDPGGETWSVGCDRGHRPPNIQADQRRGRRGCGPEPLPGVAMVTCNAPQRICRRRPSVPPPLQPQGLGDQARPLPAHGPGSGGAAEGAGAEVEPPEREPPGAER